MKGEGSEGEEDGQVWWYGEKWKKKKPERMR
jgi:hypothetical protein